MSMTHYTNDELELDGRVIGWAMSYRQASRKVSRKLPATADIHNAFVFWPVTKNFVRGDFVVIEEPLYNGASLNREAVMKAANVAA